MFSLFRNRFGVPGVIAVVALVFAMIGGAYAASGGLTAKQKKEVKSIAKSFQGTGPAGPKGDAGAAGSNGAPGGLGEKGATGAKGATGDKGAIGDPWSVGNVLPQGATMTGSWSGVLTSAATLPAPISFPLPLESAPTVVIVKVGEDKSASGCPKVEEWETSGVPEVEEGKLCLYQGQGPGLEIGTPSFEVTGSKTRFGILLSTTCGSVCAWKGVWAVTGN